MSCKRSRGMQIICVIGNFKVSVSMTVLWQFKNVNKEEFCPHKSRVSQCDQNLTHYSFVSCMHMYEGLQVRLRRSFNYRVYAIDKHQPNTWISILETLESRIGMLFIKLAFLCAGRVERVCRFCYWSTVCYLVPSMSMVLLSTIFMTAINTTVWGIHALHSYKTYTEAEVHIHHISHKYSKR